MELLRQGKKLKGTNVCINEHLIKSNADLARRAREKFRLLGPLTVEFMSRQMVEQKRQMYFVLKALSSWKGFTVITELL